MEYPFGDPRRHHHHHHRRDEEEREEERYHHGPPPPFPPPSTYPPVNPDFGYPPPVHHVSHEIDPGFSQYAPAHPPPPAVQHLSHEINQGFPPQPSFTEFHHHQPGHHHPHPPSFSHHHHSDFFNKPSVRVFTKAETNYSLAIRDGKVVLSRSDPNDLHQHWIKDEKYSTRVKDEEGFPSFALVNKATGQAMKHSIGATHPVQLIPYNPDVLDESMLWADKDLGDGYRVIRMVNNIRLNLDAFNGDKNHGGVHEGTIAVLWEWKKGDNQRWMITPY